MSRYTALTASRAGNGFGTQEQQAGGEPAATAAPAGESDEEIQELVQQAQDVIAETNDLLAGLSDIAGQAGAVETDIHQGAEGSLPTQTVTVDSLIQAAPTPAPTEAPAPDRSPRPQRGGRRSPPRPDRSPRPPRPRRRRPRPPARRSM